MLGRDETLMALTVPCVPSASAAVREGLSRLDELDCSKGVAAWLTRWGPATITVA